MRFFNVVQVDLVVFYIVESPECFCPPGGVHFMLIIVGFGVEIEAVEATLDYGRTLTPIQRQECLLDL